MGREMTNPVEIKQYLLANNKYMKPSHARDSRRQPTVVSAQLYLAELVSLNQHTMEFSFVAYLRLYWDDSDLSYASPEDGGQFAYLDMSDMKSVVFVPDWYFDNSRAPTKASQEQIVLYPNGSFRWSLFVNPVLSCRMHFYDFPWDHQRCWVNLSLYSQTVDIATLAPKRKVNGDESAFNAHHNVRTADTEW